MRPEITAITTAVSYCPLPIRAPCIVSRYVLGIRPAGGELAGHLIMPWLVVRLDRLSIQPFAQLEAMLSCRVFALKDRSSDALDFYNRTEAAWTKNNAL